MSEPILVINNFSKVFDNDILKKKQIAVSDLSCEFPRGKCTGFMGHNGAGKTTTIKTIFGLIRATSGEILYKGHPITEEDKRSIGYMPEINKLAANLSCEEILNFHLRIFRPPNINPQDYPNLIEKALREVGLWDHRSKKVRQLSKGMGRRLSWAQATIHDPELVILDEPFSGLDPVGRKLITKLLNNLKEREVTTILCTHELWNINETCDELHILKEGKLSYSSISPVGGQLPKPLMNFKIELSGVSLNQLQAMKSERNLPEWEYSHNIDYLTKIGFGEYSDASTWLNEILGSGIVIVNFSKTNGFDEDTLLIHFEG